MGGAGNDALDGSGTLRGGAGDDRITLRALSSDSVLDGGEGIDTLILETVYSTAVSLEAETLTINGVTVALTGFEHVSGRGFNDQITGSALNNILLGNAGDDTLSGLLGDDYLDGGFGKDILYGGDGADTLLGGSGDDQLDGGADADVLNGGDGSDRLIGGLGDDWITMGLGDDTVDGGTGDDVVIVNLNRADVSTTRSGDTVTLRSTEGIDTLVGVEHIQFLDGLYDFGTDGALSSQPRGPFGTAGNDRLVGSGLVDVIRGGAGDDFITGGGGNDSIDGGAGIDTALYGGLRRQYVATSTGLTGGSDGRDILVSIENFGFVDGVLTFDGESAAARTLRLYDSALGRAPDQAGLENNARLLSSGMATLLDLANGFVGSAEFQARFGALSNQAFVEQLYRLSFDREGDASGVAGWVAALNGGMGRGQVLIGFSESPENRAQTAPTLAQGLWVSDANAQVIARLYDATFDRLPDPGGLAGWVGALTSGTPLSAIAGAFAGSPEFQARYGALSNQEFVEQLYRFCVNREGEPAGVASWVDLLNGGASRADVLIGFSESAEHIALTAPNWSGGIRYQGYVDAQQADADVGKDEGSQVSPLIDTSAPALSKEKAHDPSVSPMAEGEFLNTGWNDGIVLVDDEISLDAQPASRLDRLGDDDATLSPDFLIDFLLIDGLKSGRDHSDWI